MLEIGSGAGYLNQCIPNVIASDILQVPMIDLVCNALHLPFGKERLSGILMTNVLHHLPDPRLFFAEAGRCIETGGTIIMIEPWNNAWARFVYTYLHHEPFDPRAEEWRCEPGKPLSSANDALPWIIFSRDRAQFESQFPEWRIEVILPMMPLVYLFSGGVGFRGLMPAWSYPVWRSLEKGLYWPEYKLAMFALIVLRKTHPRIPAFNTV
jgi:hypothetical protein